MAIMRTGRAPVGGSMVGKRAAPARAPSGGGGMSGRAVTSGGGMSGRAAPAKGGLGMAGRRFAEGGRAEEAQEAARKYRQTSPEYRKNRRENLKQLSEDAKERAKHPIRSVVDAAGRVKKAMGMAKGGKTAHYAKGGMVGKASKRADGCAVKGKTKGKMR